MWWLRRRLTVWALPLALLIGCGFQPAFGPEGGAGALRASIEVQAPKNRDDFDFVRHIEERLGSAGVARYDLRYTISTQTVALGFAQDGAITRYNLTGAVDWQLLERATNQELAKGRAQNFTAWSATGVTIAAVNAQTDASGRLMRILADQVVAQLIGAFAKMESLPQ
jgi:LPS-assembly lipoprotein